MDHAPTSIGRYDITGLVGEGGMGRVYRAQDPRLVRTVAIKVLPPAFAADKDLLRRFEQEARATAALNHPGVLALYDVGVHEGAPYLVSELLEGTTLRERLDAERLTARKAIEYATQVAEALAAAHDRGIVHRDLKPENLFITLQDRIKILDFGLAKLVESANPDMTRVDITGTLPSMILGTPSYMPPEQARGQVADHRADIFSLGCILYEMLQGKRAFVGENVADVLSAILKDAPDPLASSVERPLPPALDGIVQRCLAKDPAARFQSASDLAFALRGLSESGTVASPRLSVAQAADEKPPVLQQKRWRGAAVATGTLVTGVLIGVAAMVLRPAPSARPLEFLVPPPVTSPTFATMPLPGLLPTSPEVGLSPDGRLLAFVATDPSGVRKLWIRALDNSRPRPIDGTDGVTSWPFWSPTSQFVVIAVPAKRALMKVDVVDGTVEHLCALPDQTPPVPFVTGSWSGDGTILFSVGGKAGLYRVSASGGSVSPATSLDTGRGDNYHSWPQFLPDGRFLMFVRTDSVDTNGVYAASLDSKDTVKVMATSARALYAAGRLLWAIDDRLVAQPFDASSLRLSGSAETVVPAVYQGAGRTAAFWASAGDALVYATGDTRERQFRWFDRAGTALETVGPPGLYVTFDLSNDRSKLAVEVSKDTARYSTLSLFDTDRGVFTPLTSGDQNDSDPRFAADGEMVFARNSRDGAGLMRLDPASGRISTLVPRGTQPVMWMEDWAADGSSVVYRTAANRDGWQLLAGASEPRKLTNTTEPVEQLQLAPGGQWLAYNSADTGRSEVFLSSVPFAGERKQVSIAGGVQPTWRSDGRELYYLGLDGGVYAVDITSTATSISAGPPRLVFRSTLPVISAVVEQYRPSADGQRFLFCLPLTSVQREPLRMLLNWPAKLDRAARNR